MSLPRTGDWSGYVTVNGVEEGYMHHYVFEFSGEAGHFRFRGRNHDDDPYTIAGTIREDDGATRVTFDKTYSTDPPQTLCYIGVLDRQLRVLSGTIVNGPQDSKLTENGGVLDGDAPSDVRTFLFKHVTPNDLRKPAHPIYLVDSLQTRNWFLDFLIMRELFGEDTNAGNQLFRILSPEEYLSIWNALESDPEDEKIWGRVLYHQCVPFSNLPGTK